MRARKCRAPESWRPETSARLDHGPVDRDDLVDHRLAREPRARANAGGLAEPSPQLRAREEFDDGVGERRDISGRNQQARLPVLDDLRDASQATRNGGAAGHRSLGQRQREPLALRRRQDHEIERRQNGGGGGDQPPETPPALPAPPPPPRPQLLRPASPPPPARERPPTPRENPPNSP